MRGKIKLNFFSQRQNKEEIVMKPIMELKDVKEAMKEMKEQQKRCFVSNATLSSEAENWLRNEKYLIKISGQMIAVAKAEKDLPTEEDLAELEQYGERQEAALRELLELLTITTILDELFS